MDTGNPVFVLEHPVTTLETLAPYVVTLHLRDSVIYEHPRGVAVQWVPLGEGPSTSNSSWRVRRNFVLVFTCM
jgi:hypothetical protein